MLSSITSGRLIARTGRYRIYPIIGTGITVIGLLLLSRMDPHTPVLVAASFMAVLGLGLGMVMQVLILAVQNDAPYEDLGVATAGATLFRSIGGLARHRDARGGVHQPAARRAQHAPARRRRGGGALGQR